MSMRLFERRELVRRQAERRRYDRRMTVPDHPLDVERRQWPERREVVVERRDHDDRRGN